MSRGTFDKRVATCAHLKGAEDAPGFRPASKWSLIHEEGEDPEKFWPLPWKARMAYHIGARYSFDPFEV